MLLNADHARLDLDHRRMAHLADACGTRVDCVDGVAWVTVDGDRRDIVLTRGQSHVLDSNANVIVSAIDGSAAVEVHANAAKAPCSRPRTTRRARLFQSLRGWMNPASPVAA